MIEVVRQFRPSCDPRDIFPIKQAKSLETLSLTENWSPIQVWYHIVLNPRWTPRNVNIFGHLIKIDRSEKHMNKVFTFGWDCKEDSLYMNILTLELLLFRNNLFQGFGIYLIFILWPCKNSSVIVIRIQTITIFAIHSTYMGASWIVKLKRDWRVSHKTICGQIKKLCLKIKHFYWVQLEI